ncbi:alpha/beta fold hydrolase [Chitinimonas viridis]|uniref:Alpha/beta fold hydrolase n=1 Tax=Chitinimonas viridis TaxID=664880 RepID=A0ABT8AZT8_9NEIS|nr:alpha/beta fold hydrolase [Chitinimonas viridis]MDN3575512.1 alpha/beta fold hydrolase [Chitinimonas viridis]
MTAADSPHLLLLPGLLNDARLWQHQTAVLGNMAHVAIADLTGADSIAALATTVLAQAPAERFALAGLSMGGYVALEIMRQAPERVLALALLDTSARPDSAQATENRLGLMELAEKDFPAVLATLLPRLLHPSQLHDAALVGTVNDMATDLGKQVFIRQQTAILGRPDSRPTLGAIRCPTLVLCGKDDVITPLEVHEELVAGIAGAKLVVIETCGHLSTLCQPQQVAEALEVWLFDIKP